MNRLIRRAASIRITVLQLKGGGSYKVLRINGKTELNYFHLGVIKMEGFLTISKATSCERKRNVNTTED